MGYISDAGTRHGACFLFIWVELSVIEQDDSEGDDHEWHDVEVDGDVEVSAKLVDKNKQLIPLIWRRSWLVNDVLEELAGCSDVANSLVALCALDHAYLFIHLHLVFFYLINEIVVLFE